MTSEIDIYRSAALVLRDHGREALDTALGRARELDEAGDGMGAATWRRIAQAIATLQKSEPAPDETRH